MIALPPWPPLAVVTGMIQLKGAQSIHRCIGYTVPRPRIKVRHNARIGPLGMTVNFRDVKEDLLARITGGEWAPDGLLPNEVDLADAYGCARAMVNRAMRELADEGLIERRRKAGTRVRAVPIRQARFSIPIVRQEIEEQGAKYRYELLRQTDTVAPDWLAKRLSLPETAPVLHLTCLHRADGAPYQFEDRWINLAALPQATAADFATTGPNEWLVSTVPYSNAEISFSAETADPSLARHLDCDPGAALFTAERATWWQDDAITFVRLSFRPGH